MIKLRTRFIIVQVDEQDFLSICNESLLEISLYMAHEIALWYNPCYFFLCEKWLLKLVVIIGVIFLVIISVIYFSLMRAPLRLDPLFWGPGHWRKYTLPLLLLHLLRCHQDNIFSSNLYSVIEDIYAILKR